MTLKKTLVWVNIFIQMFTPYISFLTPAVAREAPYSTMASPFVETRVYTLNEGETAVSVASKYNMSLDELRKLNQFRVFSRGFDNLKAGDELDVPVISPADTIKGKKNPQSLVNTTQDPQSQKFAGYVSQTGSFLSNHPDEEAAASLAKGMVTGAANSEVQQWLSQFGTARVQLDADQKFSLKNSQLDLLLPLYEQENRLFFTQGGYHRTDERNQANLGFGYRWFTDDWMLGGNTFFDYDLSRDHARAGVGVEYWRDYLKLGANSYRHLTSWKNSPDVSDYEERPANGWDIRAQAWLPALPQLGGKLMYEQYYGNEVALFGTENRQHNPHAVTAEISYTPVPLLTLSASQRQGESGQNDTRFGVDATYQFAVPWLQQINPESVAAMRSLAGSRHDLVERNNNIILEYRKKDIIHLRTASLVTGQAGETKSLGVTVTSKYGVDKVDWSDGGLVVAGGKIVQNGNDQSVVLPLWRSGSTQTNTYIMSAVAVDQKGNTSNRSETQVTVQAPVVSGTDSTFTPSNSILPADGKGTQVLTLTIKDNQGHTVSVDPDDIKLSTGKLKSAFVSDPVSVSGSPGVYTVTVHAGKDVETVTVTPVIGDTTLTPATVSIISTPADESQSSIALDANTYVSGADMTVTVMLKDAQGNAVSGAESQLTSTAVTVANADEKAGGAWTETTAGSGIYSKTYVAKATGTGLTATVQLATWANAQTSGTYDITASAADESQSSIALDANTYVSGADMTVTVMLKDAQGNAVSGAESQLTSTAVTVANADEKAGGAWTETTAGSGIYSKTYVAKATGTGLTATVQLATWANAQTSGTYDITASAADESQSSIALDANTYVSGADMTVTVMLKDAQGNAVSGAESQLTSTAVTVANADEKAGGAWTETTAGSGIYSKTYVAKATGTGLTATVQLATWANAQTSGTYDITASAADESQSSIALDANTYVSGADMTVTVMLKDAQGNAVSGAESQLTSTAVTVANADEKAGGAWTETTAGSGIYSKTYVAKATGTGLTATVQLATWANAQTSGTYDITASAADESQSSIALDANTYVSGADMTVTVMLKDAQGNAVSGAESQLTSTAVTVANADEKAGGAWTETTAGSGIYSKTYVAKATGTGLTATVQLATWANAQTSGTYDITASAADESQSSIALDANTYVSGADMTVTVMLKDAQGNAVSGAESQLTSTAVTVANADEKAGGAWTETTAGSGIYSKTYVAKATGTGLTATVQLATWANAQTSGTYDITASAADESQSSIALDANTYVSGADMTVTVMLKDAQGNAVSGAESQLTSTAVTVANADEKAGGAWTETTAGSGIYSKTYVAKATGTGLTATVQLATWANAQTSGTYDITASAADESQSSIALDANTYVSGADMTVTVMLKDAQGNAVSGAESQLTSTAVTVANADEKAGGAWTETTAGSGIYSKTYVAKATGTGLTATVQLATWANAQTSGTYDITASAADESQSSIALDANTYVSGADMTVTVMLKDAQGNAVSGAESQLTSTAVTVANADEKAGGAWTETTAGSGIYSKTYVAKATGTGLTATVQLATWANAQTSGTYDITASAADESQSSIALDANTYVSGADMTVTVMLKDAQGNAVSGAESQLTSTAVTVANADEKAGGAWTETTAGSGIYSKTYVAKATGTGLTATVQLATWANAQTSGTYDITASAADESQSSIALDANTYVSGADMTVTVMLKDAQGNAVSGAESQLTSTAVTVANADEKAGGAWTETTAGSGIYSKTYVAKATGTGLTATVQLATWANAQTSGTYDITASAADESQSSIALDANTYVSGADMTVTVMLKDAQGNAVSGAESQLTSTAVTVANADEKAGGAWTETTAGSGIYSKTYVAKATGTGLTATVQLATWANAQTSGTYDITASAADESQSSIALDANTYVSGADMTVTVMLKDAQGNAVSGAESQLTSTAVTVANADEKAGGAWTETTAGSGIYSKTYVAKATGTGLTATVQLATWANAQTSGTYDITASAADESQSSIALDANTYVSGADMTVTVMLKDAQGNAVSGAESQLTSTAVTVANADEKAGGAWTETTAGSGIYSKTYVAKATGTGLTATVQLATWANAQTSGTYDITASAADESQSSIALDANTYVSGADMTVTVMLKDAQGNAVSGAESQLTSTAVTVANADEKAGGAWTETTAGSGIYSKTYVAKATGTGLTATVQLATWANAQTSGTYDITASAADESQSSIALDANTYVSGADMTVTVMLKDAQGNAVSGAESQLTSTAVTVANADEKAGGAWTETTAGSGIYSKTYVAKATGTGLTATVQLATWANAQTSGTYDITASAADESQSSIALDANTYVSGADMTVTVMLKDAQGNAVSGAESQLTSTAVTVANADEKAGGAWTETTAGSGIYSKTYVAKATGTGLTATVQLATWANAQTSGTYDITAAYTLTVEVNNTGPQDEGQVNSYIYTATVRSNLTGDPVPGVPVRWSSNIEDTETHLSRVITEDGHVVSGTAGNTGKDGTSVYTIFSDDGGFDSIEVDANIDNALPHTQVPAVVIQAVANNSKIKFGNYDANPWDGSVSTILAPAVDPSLITFYWEHLRFMLEGVDKNNILELRTSDPKVVSKTAQGRVGYNYGYFEVSGSGSANVTVRSNYVSTRYKLYTASLSINKKVINSSKNWALKYNGGEYSDSTSSTAKNPCDTQVGLPIMDDDPHVADQLRAMSDNGVKLNDAGLMSRDPTFNPQLPFAGLRSSDLSTPNKIVGVDTHSRDGLQTYQYATLCEVN